MFSVKSIPSTTSVLSMYTTFTASAMLVRSVVSEVQTMASQFIPEQLQTLLRSKCRSFWGNPSSQMTLLIDEYNGYTINELYQACEIYLGTKITSSVDKLKVSKGPREKNLSINIDKDEIVNDVFEDVQLKWQMSCMETKEASRQGKYEKRLIELSFHKKFLEVVVNSYLPYVLERSKAIEKENQGVKLYSLGNCCDEYPANLDHPATFETLAMDPTLKKELIDDLDRFVRRRDFYKRVGKTWKRGYLLYGPPGTGKSSLIAAMANYLKYSIYDLELASIYSNSDLRRLLVSTKNRSMLVIEDIDCSIEFNDREAGNTNNSDSQLTLSGLLNFIDGLWSSCGDERIIVFTTNHRDKLDPALLRPGRMDMHIHMSYCTPDGFRILASNYLGINSHDLFAEIDELIKEVVKVTPAEVAEELMKSEDADVALAGLIKFLKNKKSGSCDSDSDQRVGSKRETTGIITNGNSKKASKKRKPKRSKA